MKEIYAALQSCPLFEGIGEEDLPVLLNCLGMRVIEARKGQVVFQEGEQAVYIGILLSGTVHLLREDYYGNRSILTHVEPGQLFGESYAFSESQSLPVSVVAEEDSRIVLIDSRQVTARCAKACGFHNRVIFNLLRLVATKNLMLHQKIQVTSKRTTREKLMAYLLHQAKLHGSSQFTIPYDRQALADYLEVDRSGLSAEISKLRREGVLECDRSTFRLL